ncbi:hypothetical protein Bca52824_009944 [Brassica carinata]|uniref:Sulfotransferase n=1 Tax=Brassica carinata TaxID=52824 RepID=A0A8X7WC97_BRACI|nr:hypothetical protein Bca52824_009944 [Brassica carinata]
MDPKELSANIRDDKVNEETKKLISSLPSHTDSQGQKICQYQGCTTWLKALTVALLERSKNHSSSDDHPLLYDNPHGIVPFLETDQCSSSNLAKFSASPKLLSTHMPLQAMHETLKNSSCKILRSLEDLKHILFMRYEEMNSEPHKQIKRLADFLGCPSTKKEEDSGVNKTEKIKNMDHKFYFRKGEVGDSKSYLTSEMEDKIDMIIQEKLQGSGLKF